MGDGSRLEGGRALILPGEFDWGANRPVRRIGHPSACNEACRIGRSAKCASLASWIGALRDRMELSTNSFGDRLTVGYLTLNQVIEVRILFPELGEVRANSLCPSHYLTRGSNGW